MRALTNAYHLAVLWLLSIAARGVVEAIYNHGHDDGSNELRDWMRRELQAVQVATVTERMRSYNRGFHDAVQWLEADEPVAEAPIERVM